MNRFRSTAALLLSFWGFSVLACNCASLPLEERVRESDAVFVGAVVSHQPLAFVELNVLEAFKFKDSLGMRNRVPTGLSDCDYFVRPVHGEPGEHFLIFLTLRNGEVSVSRCLGSKPVSEAANELSVLRRLDRARR